HKIEKQNLIKTRKIWFVLGEFRIVERLLQSEHLLCLQITQPSAGPHFPYYVSWLNENDFIIRGSISGDLFFLEDEQNCVWFAVTCQIVKIRILMVGIIYIV